MSAYWTWSAPHNDYYYVTFDANGQMVYVWGKEEAQPQRMGTTQTILTPKMVHGRVDSAMEPTDVTASTDLIAQPAPSVPFSVRAFEPNFIAGNPEEGWYDVLDASYRMRTGTEARLFFKLGRVFSMLYTETSSETRNIRPDDDAFTVVRFGDREHTQIRRFVVVSVRKNFVHACAISTYRNQGTFKRGCDPGEHALIYNTGVDPKSCLFQGERENGMTKESIEVHAADDSSYLTKESRIRFGKIYSIEWNVKVKDIGLVVEQDLSTLLAHYDAENARWRSAA